MTDKDLNQIRAEAQAEIERATGARVEQQREADEARRAEVEEHNRNWRARRDAQLKAERERRESAEAQRLESELRRRFLAAGGTRDDFDASRDDLIRRHLEDVTLGHGAPVAGEDFSDPRRWGLGR